MTINPALVEQYGLRATFFASELANNHYVGMTFRAEKFLKTIDAGLQWQVGTDKSLSTDLIGVIRGAGLMPSKFFCHPNVLIAQPWMLRYYRCLAAISVKGLKAVSGVSSVEKIEEGADPTVDQAGKLSIALNRNLALIFTSALDFDEERSKAVFYAQAGSTLDGSWRNAIGEEGERFVRALLIRGLQQNGELVSVSMRGGRQVNVIDIDSREIDVLAKGVHTITCTNSSVVRFASEPDIECITPDGNISACVEVKAGLDPAAALERLGAMTKSFREVRQQYPGAETILLASCITPEVQKRLNADRNVSRTLSLSDVITNSKKDGVSFVNLLRAKLGLIEEVQ
jgi:XcyI restriction endonuclease